MVRDLAITCLGFGAVPFITLIMLLFQSRAYAPKIASIRDGMYWAHWRYDMGEWERFIAQEHRRNRSMLVRVAPLLMFAIVVVDVASSGTSDLGPDTPAYSICLCLVGLC